MPIAVRPSGVKFYGGYLAIRNATEFSNGLTGWTDLWGNWDWPFVKSQIDATKSLGGNCIGICGTGLGGETIGLSAYLARRRQLIKYCADVGMYVAVTGSSSSPSGAMAEASWGITRQEWIDFLVADAEVVCQFDNVIFYMPIDEPFNLAPTLNGGSGTLTAAQVITLSQDVYAAVKAVVPSSMPVAYPCNPGFSLGSSTWVNYLDAMMSTCCDFLPLQSFDATGISNTPGYRTRYPNHEIFFTSVGTNRTTDNSATITSRTNYWLNHVNTLSYSRGLCIWTIRDWIWDGVSSLSGMWNNAITVPYTAITTPFTAAVTGPYPRRAPSRLRNFRLNNARQWGHV